MKLRAKPIPIYFSQKTFSVTKSKQTLFFSVLGC